MTMTQAAVRRAARQTLGYDELLPGQAEAVRAVVDGRDTLALLPTGGGKSAIYQLAGEALHGPTLVVSPLIALQRDQLDALREAGFSARAMNSTIGRAERAATLDAWKADELEFLLLAPEQVTDDETLDALRHRKPRLFVVDEAHCVAEWGHDFRPEYRRLGAVAETLGRPPILGLTATASPLIRDEIVERLHMRDPLVVARGFDRPNIRLDVKQHVDAAAKRRALVDFVSAHERPGIVYVATRRAAAEVAAEMRSAGIEAEGYHAGLGDRRRREVEEAFMGGRRSVMVATIAFGMGVDKPDVRFVAHHDVSESLDAYHQEIGRAGRDGESAQAILFYRAGDLGLRRFQSGPARLRERDVARVVRVLRRSRAVSVESLSGSTTLSQRKVDAIVGRLEEIEAVAVQPDGTLVPVDPEALRQTGIASDVVARQERRRLVERSRVEMIRGYAETTGCRRAFLLGYFGEPFDPPCGNCDRCLADPTRVADAVGRAASIGGSRLEIDNRVRHAVFGAGTVTAIEPGRVTVAFDEVGYRVIDLATAREREILAPLPE